ncbi:synaptobrevin homolog YKT6-like [Hippopotamus amphibius kiboko]|uniref:synaptobrevin homolog YKT6-like n=1 Tax=Hippopotamus amphibius kiboko TaxID=575201 RepID=UPI002593F201|nr:synaptobrevin homolog YKT6-like [Hippopotamus amphibius kiboko]
MKLYSLSVLYKGDTKTVLLKAAYDVSSFSFFQRSSVQEFMTFTSQLIAERSSKGSRASVKEQEYLCHVYVRNDSLAGVVIADSEYPSRVAFTLLEKVLDEFSKEVHRIDWPVGSPDTIRYAGLDSHLSRHQNPREADPTTKVQAELDETKIILHDTMESLLERGEKLDDLVSKSEVLGIPSKTFYKTARKQNACCAIVGQQPAEPLHWDVTVITSERRPPGSRAT